MAVALTTKFSPPPQCTDMWQITYDAEHTYGLLGGSGYSSCLPPSFVPTSTFYYSPGLQCPEGYSTAAKSLNSIGTETETVLTCCPTGYSTRTISNEMFPWEPTLGCTSACSSRYTETEIGSSTIKNIVCDVGGGNHAYSVQLRFRAEDLVTATSSTPPPPTSSGASPSSISAPAVSTSTTASSSTSVSSKSGLSTGAKAGIGVGTALGVTLIAAILYLAWVIRKKSKSTGRTTVEPSTSATTPAPIPIVEAPSQSKYNPHQAYHQRHELD
ncbi:hypothetical protein BDV96DRAFT_281307 [Lophiotrema nucula]|uniref:WSC domain-containing protein n=1 Tax=Lophiotrema nucula TaxID=690887 RepID=A0A6A5ZNX7_9PLEO|nr:hypothetical protein BDV96DRAFT_281307 [Lophiotrema nucula]